MRCIITFPIFGAGLFSPMRYPLRQRHYGPPLSKPLRDPPGEGLSSATVNVLWGSFNLLVAYWLLCRVGKFDLRRTAPVLVAGLGALLMALMLAYAFGRFYGGNI